jgi:hypothetical protein
MGKNFQSKNIITKTPAESVEHQVRFEPHRFNSLIFDKGYDVWIDKAYRCPCSVKGTGQPLLTCDNCLGTGWIFKNRIETRVAIQGIKVDVKYENWTRTTSGMAKITARAIDKLAFMDRIILKDVEGYYNEILRTRIKGNKNIAYTEYPIIEIEELLLFQSDKLPLRKLIKDVDYFVEDESKIILNSSYSLKDYVLTIRYRHYMTYHIIEMNRDIIKVRQKDCELPEETLSDMPINGIIRKAHYLFDNIKYEAENRLIDNDN